MGEETNKDAEKLILEMENIGVQCYEVDHRIMEILTELEILKKKRYFLDLLTDKYQKELDAIC